MAGLFSTISTIESRENLRKCERRAPFCVFFVSKMFYIHIRHGLGHGFHTAAAAADRGENGVVHSAK